MNGIDQIWTYKNKRYYKWSLMFALIVIIWGIFNGLLVFAEMMLILIHGQSHQRGDIALPLIVLVVIICLFSITYWTMKMRYFYLNPSFRLNEKMMEIDNKPKIRFNWEEVEEVVLTEKVSLVGLLYNIERDAIVFKLKDGRQPFIMIARGLYICKFDQFIKHLEEYIPTEKIHYEDRDAFEAYLHDKRWHKCGRWGK